MEKFDRRTKKVLANMFLNKDKRLAELLWEEAVSTDDKKLASELIINGITTKNGNSKLLENAASNGSYKVVKKLVNNGFTEGYRDAIWNAIKCDEYKIAQYIVREMKDLKYAILLGDMDLVQEVSKSKTVEEITDALQHAAFHNCSIEIIHFLVEGAGANIDDAEVLKHAVSQGNVELVEYCLELGAKLNCTSELLNRIEYYADNEIPITLINAGIDVNRHNYLSVALSKGKVKIAEALIEAGVDVNQGKNANERPLNLAVRLGNYSIVKKLLEKGATISEAESRKGELVDTALFVGRNLKVAKVLVEEGAEINKQSLASTVYNGNYDEVEFLVNSGATIASYNLDKNMFQIKDESKFDVRIAELLKKKFGFKGKFIDNNEED